MTRKVTLSELLRLSVPERIQMVEDLWDSIAEAPESVTLTDQQSAELDARLDAYHKDPQAGSPWAVVKENIRKNK